MIFFVTIPVKLYVKRFLENNYGNPVDFRKFPREHEMFKRMLKRPNKNYDVMYPVKSLKKPDYVEVVISDHDFYRFGWELSRTDIVAFGKYFESRAKWVMRTVIGSYVSFGAPLDRSINLVQQRFAMGEEYWPFDSIKKDFYRLRTSIDVDMNAYAFNHLERLIRINMKNAGIITEIGLKIN